MNNIEKKNLFNIKNKRKFLKFVSIGIFLKENSIDIVDIMDFFYIIIMIYIM